MYKKTIFYQYICLFLQKNYGMQTENHKQIGLDLVIKNAFQYWRKSILYQLLVSLISFCILIMIGIHFGQKYGILEEYIRLVTHSGDIVQIQNGVQKLMSNPNMETLSIIFLGTKAFLFPLELGLFKIYRKMDNSENIHISDLFSGYVGINFFILVGYYLFWYFIYSYTLFTLVLPIVWILCTIFVAPLIFFMNQPMLKSIGINLKVLRIYFIPILICGIVAFLFKYSGFLLFGFGFLLTYSFSTAMIYALYQTIFKEERR